MTRSRKYLLITVGIILLYILSFGPILGWYSARNQPPPAAIAGFYVPIHAALGEPGLALPFVTYLYLWELIYGGH